MALPTGHVTSDPRYQTQSYCSSDRRTQCSRGTPDAPGSTIGPQRCCCCGHRSATPPHIAAADPNAGPSAKRQLYSSASSSAMHVAANTSSTSSGFSATTSCRLNPSTATADAKQGSATGTRERRHPLFALAKHSSAPVFTKCSRFSTYDKRQRCVCIFLCASADQWYKRRLSIAT